MFVFYVISFTNDRPLLLNVLTDRDLKPENLMLATQADRAPVKIIDVGMAVTLDDGKDWIIDEKNKGIN